MKPKKTSTRKLNINKQKIQTLNDTKSALIMGGVAYTNPMPAISQQLQSIGCDTETNTGAATICQTAINN